MVVPILGRELGWDWPLATTNSADVITRASSAREIEFNFGESRASALPLRDLPYGHRRPTTVDPRETGRFWVELSRKIGDRERRLTALSGSSPLRSAASDFAPLRTLLKASRRIPVGGALSS
jgi:hypothetical protein